MSKYDEKYHEEQMNKFTEKAQAAISPIRIPTGPLEPKDQFYDIKPQNNINIDEVGDRVGQNFKKKVGGKGEPKWVGPTKADEVRVANERREAVIEAVGDVDSILTKLMSAQAGTITIDDEEKLELKAQLDAELVTLREKANLYTQLI